MAAAFGLVAAGPTRPQDATPTARDGSLSISGDLIAWDGEVFRIATAWGPLTVDAAGVICAGPACPGPTAPRARLRITGAGDPGRDLVPRLRAASAADRSLVLTEAAAVPGAWSAKLADPLTAEVLADLAFAPGSTAEARAALADRRAEVALLAAVPEGLAFRIVGSDAPVPLAAEGNRPPRLGTADLAAALAGAATNWTALGGPDVSVALRAPAADSAVGQAVADRLGHPLPDGAIPHPDAAALAAAVARDPWALALAPRSRAGPARVLPLTDSRGFPLPAADAAVTAGDYPLTLDAHVVVPRRRLPLILRAFLGFLPTEARRLPWPPPGRWTAVPPALP